MSFNKPYNDSLPAGPAGGVNQEWNILKKISQIVESIKQNGSMGVDYKELEKLLVYYPQFDPRYRKKYGVLDPENLTFEKIKSHALEKQDLSVSTVKKLMDYLAKMELHSLYPIDFNKPDWEQFFRYMDHVKTNGDVDRYGNLKPVGVHGLINRRKAWYMYTVAIGFEDIYPKYRIPKRKIPDKSRDVPLCNPETVYALLNYKYENDRDLNRYIQYLFFFGFFIGAAPEKEWIILNIDDIVIDKFGNRYITIKRPKVGNKPRKLKLEKTIALSPVHKSFYNYLTYIRPKFAAKNEKSLFPDPKTKKRWSCTDDLRRFLTRYGKRVYPPFYPYLMRHWCGTARMIEWDKQGNAFSRVNYWLGHKDPNMTKRYCDFAQLFNDDNGSWLSRSLKQDWLGGLGDSRRIAQETVKKGVVVQNTSKGVVEFPQARFRFYRRFCTTVIDFWSCCAERILNYSLKKSGVFI